MAIKKKSQKLKKTAGRSAAASPDEDEDEDEETEEEETEETGTEEEESEDEDESEEEESDEEESEDEDEESEDEDEDEEEEKPKEKTKSAAKAKEQAKPSGALVKLFVSYDQKVSEAEKSFIALVEYIQEKQLDRNTVIASMMKARGISYESASAKYGQMKKIYNNEEVLKELKEGKITLRVAREKTKSKQKNPASSKPANKEAKFTKTLASFTAAAKESGFSRAEILTSVTASLKAAGIK